MLRGAWCVKPLVRGREIRQSPARVERGEELAVLVLGPRLAGLRRQLLLAPLEALRLLQRLGRRIQRAYNRRALVDAVGGKHFARFRIDAVGERAHHAQCF